MKNLYLSEIIDDKMIENCGLICPKCGEKININKLNDIILNNNKITNFTDEIGLRIENISKKYSNDLLINIDDILKMIKEEIKINNKILFNIMNNNKEINITLNSNNKKELSNNRVLNEIDNKKDSIYIKSNYLKYINYSKIKKNINLKEKINNIKILN